MGSKYDPSEWGLTKVDPNYDLYSNNIRCGRDGHLSGKGTQTATVVAGSEIGVRINGWNVSCILPSPLHRTYTFKNSKVAIYFIPGLCKPISQKLQRQTFSPILTTAIGYVIRLRATFVRQLKLACVTSSKSSTLDPF